MKIGSDIHTHFYTVNTDQDRFGNWDTTWRILPNVLLERPRGGSWRCHFQGGSVDVPDQHILVVPPACRHRLVKNSTGNMSSDWVYLTWYSQQSTEINIGHTPIVLQPQPNTRCFNQHTDLGSTIDAHADALHILSACLQKLPQTQQIDDDRIQQVILFMRKHLHEPIDRNALAAQCHLSATRFHDVFTQETGVAPMRYLSRLRLQQAQILLTQKELSIAEISEHCGFESQSYFNRVFKKAFAISPSIYRKR